MLFNNSGFLSHIWLATSTTTIYSPPSPLSLHFWWYPLIVMGIFASPFIGVAYGMKCDQGDLIMMVLIGLVQASWIAYFMQIYPFGLLMLGLGGFLLILWRGA